MIEKFKKSDYLNVSKQIEIKCGCGVDDISFEYLNIVYNTLLKLKEYASNGFDFYVDLVYNKFNINKHNFDVIDENDLTFDYVLLTAYDFECDNVTYLIAYHEDLEYLNNFTIEFNNKRLTFKEFLDVDIDTLYRSTPTLDIDICGDVSHLDYTPTHVIFNIPYCVFKTGVVYKTMDYKGTTMFVYNHTTDMDVFITLEDVDVEFLHIKKINKHI